MNGGIEYVLSQTGQKKGDQHDGKKWKAGGRQHTDRQQEEPQQHHEAIPQSIGKGTEEQGQQATGLVDGDHRGDMGKGHAHGAAQGGGEGVGKPSGGIQNQAANTGQEQVEYQRLSAVAAIRVSADIRGHGHLPGVRG